MMRLFHSIYGQRRVALWVLLGAAGCNAAACLTALLLLPSVISIAQNTLLALISSLIYVGLVVGISAGVAELQFRRLRAGLKRTAAIPLFNGIPWFAPVVLICRAGGMWAIVAAGALAFANGKLLARFGFFMPSDPAAQHLRVTAAVCVAYAGVFSAVGGMNAIGIVLICVSCFFIGQVEQRYATSDRQPAATAVLRFVFHFFWASFVTVLLLLPHSWRLSMAELNARLWETHGEKADAGTLQSGVILFAKRKPPVLLDLPLQAKFQTHGLRRPFSIAFSGEYWFFQQPRSPLSDDDWFFQQSNKRLPASSLKEEGDPTTLHMTLEDHSRMVMRAQQRIGKFVDTQCCRWIDLVLNGEDQQPQSVDVELLLVNSSSAGKNIDTLGLQSLAHPFDTSAAGDSKSSTFRFKIPANLSIHSFNEFLVWFHLKPPRRHKSATIRIDRFDLLP